MKAMIMPVSRPIPPRKAQKSNGVTRKARKCLEENEEMATMELLFHKLLHMIPTLPKDRKVSRLEILQHVIEYIQDLESQVQFHPEAENLCTGLNYLRISLQHKTVDL
ncbi:hypothetical protein RvY_10103 [Ramazzottius varieornatus]|uniref:BHLH domain-containing protein n=1 Tax=Ramazzottius varieornatus TaxID=947166 RepID=A0A1D1VDS1_RAMVA|nr:hypothetical protein RvY_10103 [Ramazzottius varieornatus]